MSSGLTQLAPLPGGGPRTFMAEVTFFGDSLNLVDVLGSHKRVVPRVYSIWDDLVVEVSLLKN